MTPLITRIACLVALAPLVAPAAPVADVAIPDPSGYQNGTYHPDEYGTRTSFGRDHNGPAQTETYVTRKAYYEQVPYWLIRGKHETDINRVKAYYRELARKKNNPPPPAPGPANNGNGTPSEPTGAPLPDAAPATTGTPMANTIPGSNNIPDTFSGPPTSDEKPLRFDRDGYAVEGDLPGANDFDYRKPDKMEIPPMTDADIAAMYAAKLPESDADVLAIVARAREITDAKAAAARDAILDSLSPDAAAVLRDPDLAAGAKSAGDAMDKASVEKFPTDFTPENLEKILAGSAPSGPPTNLPKLDLKKLLGPPRSKSTPDLLEKRREPDGLDYPG